MKRKYKLDYGQWIMIISIAACVMASWSRLMSHQLWQDITIIISGVILGLFGLLLACNWHGLTDRYSKPLYRLSPKQPRRRTQQFTLIRVSGVLLTFEALAAIISSILWIVTLINNAD